MKKVLRLTESELINLIKNAIHEEESKEEKVKKIQKFLIGKGYDLGDYGKNGDGIDGKYGKLTKKAVEEFQKKHGNLKIDGKVGTETAKAMGNNIEPVFKSKSQSDELKKEEPKKKLGGPVSVNFLDIAKKVINKLEGGYFNPKWHKGTSLDSGETMFGMDRKHGKRYRESAAGKKFWEIIDKNKNEKVWTHYYRGGEFESELTKLAVEQIEPVFYEYKKEYLSDEAEKIVDRSSKLIFHFAYAVWNGPQFFQLFANKINKAVKNGTTDIDELEEIALNSRKNFVSSKNEMSTVVIQRGGRRMEEIFKSGLV
jgi:hypothetical protein